MPKKFRKIAIIFWTGNDVNINRIQLNHSKKPIADGYGF